MPIGHLYFLFEEFIDLFSPFIDGLYYFFLVKFLSVPNISLILASCQIVIYPFHGLSLYFVSQYMDCYGNDPFALGMKCCVQTCIYYTPSSISFFKVNILFRSFSLYDVPLYIITFFEYGPFLSSGNPVQKKGLF